MPMPLGRVPPSRKRHIPPNSSFGLVPARAETRKLVVRTASELHLSTPRGSRWSGRVVGHQYEVPAQGRAVVPPRAPPPAHSASARAAPLCYRDSFWRILMATGLACATIRRWQRGAAVGRTTPNPDLFGRSAMPASTSSSRFVAPFLPATARGPGAKKCQNVTFRRELGLSTAKRGARASHGAHGRPRAWGRVPTLVRSAVCRRAASRALRVADFWSVCLGPQAFCSIFVTVGS